MDIFLLLFAFIFILRVLSLCLSLCVPFSVFYTSVNHPVYVCASECVYVCTACCACRRAAFFEDETFCRIEFNLKGKTSRREKIYKDDLLFPSS